MNPLLLQTIANLEKDIVQFHSKEKKKFSIKEKFNWILFTWIISRAF
jgi:hypothetical protein